MLTPAEELGLSGLRLASRVRKAFERIPEPDLAALMQRMREECYRRHVVYLRDNVAEAIRVMPCPVTVLPDQLPYITYVSQTILNALKRLPELYLHDPAIREILLLTPAEEEWLRDCWGPSHGDSNPVFGRLDAMIDFISPMWKDSLRFVEPNLGSIGGLHLIPTAERIVADVVLPVLQAEDHGLRLEGGLDVRELLMQEILDHAQAIGRRLENLCFVEPKYVGSGPDEQEEIARFYHARYGMRIMHADPRELTLEGEEVFYEGARLDIAYRDYTVYDLVELQREGVDVAPMRALLRQNRVMSSVAAELDQKSCWEVFTNPTLARKYFSAEERQLFHRHILWTRLLSDRRTLLPNGRTGSLLDHVRRERETLVVKPNRAFGGEGVYIGPACSDAEWQAAVDRALVDHDSWVVQQLASIPVHEFPGLGPNGRVVSEPFYTVMGFAPSKYGVAILGRASQKQVVNVAQRGGMCAVMTGHP
jgi:hypothetical protein